jgi:hypothetical protein
MAKKPEKKNIYETILEIGDLAERLEFEKKLEIGDNENNIKKIVNKPKEFTNFAYEAYCQFFSDKKD